MSRLPKIAFRTVLVFLVLLFAVLLLYVAYNDSPERIDELESRVQVMQSHLQELAYPHWITAERQISISTTDRPKITDCANNLRLVYGTNTVQKFNIGLWWKEPGHIVRAWVSDWTPRSEMSKFEQLSVSRYNGTRFEISAQVHTNESVAMKFKVTFIFM